MSISLTQTYVKNVEFYILDGEESKKGAAVEVTYGDNDIRSLYMGVTDYENTCKTCSNRKEHCPGHHGYTQLVYPLVNPIYEDYVKKWLKVICFKCSNLYTSTQRVKIPNPRPKALDAYATSIKGKEKECTHCGTPKYKIVDGKALVAMVLYEEVTKSDRRRIWNFDILRILKGIPDKIVKRFYKHLEHPAKCINEYMHVAPNTIRPDIKKFKGAGSTNNDLTTLLKNIVLKNDEIRLKLGSIKIIKSVAQIKGAIVIDLIDKLMIDYYAMFKNPTIGKSVKAHTISNKGQQLVSIQKRTSNKTGRIRGDLLGCRSTLMARSVITCDPTLEIDEVGIPVGMAHKIQIRELVTVENIDKIRMYQKNGTDKYPGCISVLKKNKAYRKYLTNNKNVRIDVGDIVHRDLVNGDLVLINRAPTLMLPSIRSHKVKVLFKAEGNSIRINVESLQSLLMSYINSSEINL